MQQCSIVAYLALKGLSACEIYDDLETTRAPDAAAYSSVAR
jgi:hypothetical protein